MDRSRISDQWLLQTQKVKSSNCNVDTFLTVPFPLTFWHMTLEFITSPWLLYKMWRSHNPAYKMKHKQNTYMDSQTYHIVPVTLLQVNSDINSIQFIKFRIRSINVQDWFSSVEGRPTFYNIKFLACLKWEFVDFPDSSNLSGTLWLCVEWHFEKTIFWCHSGQISWKGTRQSRWNKKLKRFVSCEGFLVSLKKNLPGCRRQNKIKIKHFIFQHLDNWKRKLNKCKW